MAYFILEMKVVCVEGLKEFNLSSSNMNVYVMVELKGASLKEQNAQTNMVKGGQNPSWNYPMKFFIDRSKKIKALNSHLKFTLISKNSHEHTNVGQINVPIVELLQVPTHGSSFQNVCYPVKKSSGHTTDGKLKFAFKFVQPQAQPPPLSSPLPSLAPQFQAQDEAKAQGQPSSRKSGRLRDIATKVVMGLGVSVTSGYISRTLFDHGQQNLNTSMNYNYLPPSSSDASSTFVSGNSFYHNEATPFPFDQTTPFYSGASPLATLPYNATSAFDPTTSFLCDGDSSSFLGSVVDAAFSSFC